MMMATATKAALGAHGLDTDQMDALEAKGFDMAVLLKLIQFAQQHGPDLYKMVLDLLALLFPKPVP